MVARVAVDEDASSMDRQGTTLSILHVQPQFCTLLSPLSTYRSNAARGMFVTPRMEGPMSGLLMLAWMASPAEACGGFFCNRQEPVRQDAERIIFAVDDETDKVETHVQITYSGPAEEFAWIVPTPAVPELFVSSQALFDQLEAQTVKQFLLRTEMHGDCIWPPYDSDMVDSDSDWSSVADTDDTDGGGGFGVVVVAERRVGAYDTVTLAAESSDLLLEWLQSNGYDLPDDLGPALAPYVATDSFFVALKMAKDTDAGDLSPLGLRYDGDTPVVPITLTSVAAAPDLRLRLWMLGEHRMVPSNYLHVTINPLAVDWFDWRNGSYRNYDDLVTRAADEAGGQAFATDTVLRTADLNLDFTAWERSVDLARDADSAWDFTANLAGTGLLYADGTLDALGTCLDDLGIPLDARTFSDCPDCHPQYELQFDTGVCADAVDARVVRPAARAARLFTRLPTLTRLTSSMSPSEMTLDPMFVQNADMPLVDRTSEAVVHYECDGTEPWASPRTLVLEDGTIVPMPSEEVASTQQLDYFDVVGDAARFAAITIEQTSAAGLPEVLTDNRDLADDSLDDAIREFPFEVGTLFRPDAEAEAGCGCRTGSPAAAWSWMLLGLLAVRRR
jgi:MYXO-CTERM domain-containing protein